MADDEKIKYLYHYTTVNALKSIIENRSLRFSDFRFVNDYSEIRFGAEIFKNVIYDKLKNCSELKKAFYDNLLYMIKNLDNNQFTYFRTIKDNDYSFSFRSITDNLCSYYILSLTLNDDDKDMWSMYGKEKSGYCIKLNVNNLIKYFSNLNLFYTIKNSKVYYGKEEFKKVVEGFLLSLTSRIESNHCIDSLLDIKTSERLFSILMCGKDKAYKNENEYRLGVFLPDYLIGSNIKKVHYAKDGILFPQIEFQEIPIEEIIEEIIISPYNKSELTELGLNLFIKNQLGKGIRISKSQIPIR